MNSGDGEPLYAPVGYQKVVAYGLRKTLVVCQTALSLVLLFGAVLFVRTLVNLEHLNTGFDKKNQLLFGANPAKAGYKGAALNDFYSRVQERVSGYRATRRNRTRR